MHEHYLQKLEYSHFFNAALCCKWQAISSADNIKDVVESKTTLCSMFHNLYFRHMLVGIMFDKNKLSVDFHEMCRIHRLWTTEELTTFWN